MNGYIEFQELVESYLRALGFGANKTAGKAERDRKKMDSVIYTYGLKGKTYSREEISIVLELTEERVRQIVKDAIEEIRLQIFEADDSELFENPNESIQELRNNLSSKNVLSYNMFISNVSHFLNQEIEHSKPYLDILIDVFDFKKLKTHLHHLRDNDLIFTSDYFTPKSFIKCCYATYLTIEKHVLPIDNPDLIIGVKRKVSDGNFSNNDILLAASVIDSVGWDGESEKFYIKFERLSTANDMAYRVLFEKGEKMKLAEILKEINHRLLKTDRRPVVKQSLNSQMNMDSRLTPLGKSGVWTLKEWNEVNKTIFELIFDTLVLYNKPLTKKEIFEHIHKTRPRIPTKSLETIIYDKRFLKIKGNKFIPKEWKEIYKDRIVTTKPVNRITKENPVTEQIKNQIVNLFLESKSTSIHLSSIVKSLNTNFNFPRASVYKIISEDHDFETKLISKNKKTVMYKGDSNLQSKPSKSTSVFVSYSWESDEHKDRVISFVEFLRNKGFEADMDVKFMQEETALDFNRLMHKGILEYDKVIVILSETYKNKAESFEGGVGKEYKFITGDIENNPNKYVLTSFETISSALLNKIAPAEFKGREVVDLAKDENSNFERLFSKLTDSGGYKFSDVASNTPIVGEKYIKPFTLKK